jgi:mono/diheme cytochrome c family protein
MFMKKNLWVLLAMVILSAVVLTACGGAQATKEATKPVPAEYAGKTNPLANDADALTAGKDVYDLNCVTCHGESGAGDGPAGASLDPKPADLEKLLPGLQDDFVYWVISEGGSAAGLSASMAPYKDVLSEDERWQVIAYIRSLKK